MRGHGKFLMLAGSAAVLLSLALTSTNASAAGVQPPWSAPMVRGFPFTVPGIDNAPDLHGDVNHPQLVVLLAGNQYMVVNKLLTAFRKAQWQPDCGKAWLRGLSWHRRRRQCAGGLSTPRGTIRRLLGGAVRCFRGRQAHQRHHAGAGKAIKQG